MALRYEEFEKGDFQPTFPTAQASLGRMTPYVEGAWNAMRRDPFGGLGTIVGSGATPAIQAAVKQRFIDRIHPALARFLERRPETVKIVEDTSLSPSRAGYTTLGDTISQKGLTQDLGPQVDNAIRQGFNPADLASRIMDLFRTNRQPIGAFQQPKADVIIRLNPKVAQPATAQHEGTHAALYLTKDPATGLVPHVLQSPELGAMAVRRVPVPMQKSLDEQIIEYMAQNALKRAGMLR